MHRPPTSGIRQQEREMRTTITADLGARAWPATRWACIRTGNNQRNAHSEVHARQRHKDGQLDLEPDGAEPLDGLDGVSFETTQGQSDVHRPESARTTRWSVISCSPALSNDLQ